MTERKTTWLNVGKLKEILQPLEDDTDVVLISEDGGVRMVTDIALLESKYEDHKGLAVYSGFEPIEQVSAGFLKEVLWGATWFLKGEKKDDRNQKS